MNNNNDEELQREVQQLQLQAELRRLRRDVGYAALPAKVTVGAAACIGFLILAMAITWGGSIAYDLIEYMSTRGGH
jgi:hypothetical protein